MTNETHTLARRIAKSAHQGRTSRLVLDAQAATFTAAELATMITAGKLPVALTGETCLWVSVGAHSDGSGRELFARERLVAQEDGSLAVYDHDGAIVLVRTADRPVRVLITGRADMRTPAQQIAESAEVWAHRNGGPITRKLLDEVSDSLCLRAHPRTLATLLNRAARAGYFPADWLRTDPRRWEWDGTPKVRASAVGQAGRR